jgi:hypothetical protein
MVAPHDHIVGSGGRFDSCPPLSRSGRRNRDIVDHSGANLVGAVLTCLSRSDYY